MGQKLKTLYQKRYKQLKKKAYGNMLNINNHQKNSN